MAVSLRMAVVTAQAAAMVPVVVTAQAGVVAQEAVMVPAGVVALEVVTVLTAVVDPASIMDRKASRSYCGSHTWVTRKVRILVGRLGGFCCES